jgi:hypothetical protein
MDKPVLIIEAPELDDDAADRVLDFLQELINAFDVHYYFRKKQCQKLLHCRHRSDEDTDSKDRF